MASGVSRGVEKLIALRETALFGGLPYEDLCSIGEIAQPVTLSADDVVVREGDPGDALFVVASGTVRVERSGTTLTTVGAGGVFGEMALLDGAPRAASVVAATDAQLLRIPRAEFEALLDASPDLVRGVIATLLDHLA